MRAIALNNGFVTLVDDEDAERVAAFRWRAYWFKRSGHHYVVAPIRQNGQSRYLLLHRYLLQAEPGQIVDHANGDTLDNRRSINLRFATASQNCANHRLSRSSSSGFTGVSWHRRILRWSAYIKASNRRLHLGYFSDPAEAARAYDRAALEHFGGFARLNFPEAVV